MTTENNMTQPATRGTELLPCPFCGALFKRHDAIGNAMICQHFAGCFFGVTLFYEDEVDKMQSWNHRAPPRREVELERLANLVIQKFKEIDQDTKWRVVEPKWWLLFSEIERVAHKSLYPQKD